MRAALCWRMLRGHSVQVINLFMRFHISNGTITPAEQLVSPNFGERPKGVPIDLVVVHSISLPPGEYGTGAVQRFFCNQPQVSEHPYFEEIAGLKVSAHVLIERSGKVTQFVNLDRRAWHAGRSCYEGREECNNTPRVHNPHRFGQNDRQQQCRPRIGSSGAMLCALLENRKAGRRRCTTPHRQLPLQNQT